MTDNVDYYREALGHNGAPREVRICSGDVGSEGVDGLKSKKEKKDGWPVDCILSFILEHNYTCHSSFSLFTGIFLTLKGVFTKVF